MMYIDSSLANTLIVRKNNKLFKYFYIQIYLKSWTNLVFKALLVTLISTGLIDGQAVINFKMYAIQNPNLPTGSSTLTKYYVVKLDRSKAGSERCVENEECNTGICLSSGLCQSGTYFAVAQRFASNLYSYFNLLFYLI